MARMESIHYRLQNWALWKAREAAGGLGFASRSSFLREAVSGYREAQIPIIDEDAAITDQAVASLKTDKPAQHQTVCLHYTGDRDHARLTVLAIAKQIGISERGVQMRLEEADRSIARWLEERDEARKRAAGGVMHTSAR
jgi:AraC-like DNA-binding protein